MRKLHIRKGLVQTVPCVVASNIIVIASKLISNFSFEFELFKLIEYGITRQVKYLTIFLVDNFGFERNIKVIGSSE